MANTGEIPFSRKNEAGILQQGWKDSNDSVFYEDGLLVNPPVALFDLSTYMDHYRLPELFCGFERHEGEGPVSYPVACLPQAWAAGSALLLVQACLGLRVDGVQNQVIFDQPTLPLNADSLHIRHLRIGELDVDLMLRRTNNGVDVAVSDDRISLIVK